eukprot:775529-Pelagomonas_calceolata.AAC.1
MFRSHLAQGLPLLLRSFTLSSCYFLDPGYQQCLTVVFSADTKTTRSHPIWYRKRSAEAQAPQGWGSGITPAAPHLTHHLVPADTFQESTLQHDASGSDRHSGRPEGQDGGRATEAANSPPPPRRQPSLQRRSRPTNQVSREDSMLRKVPVQPLFSLPRPPPQVRRAPSVKGYYACLLVARSLCCT